jgi:hypothetical protein
MINRLLVNRAHTNRGRRRDVVEPIEVDLMERLDGVFVLGADEAVVEQMANSLLGSVSVELAVFAAADLLEELSGACDGESVQAISGGMAEALQGSLSLGADERDFSDLLEALQGALLLGADERDFSDLFEELQGALMLGADEREEADFHEILTGFASIYSLREESLFVNGAIPAGGTLVIDTGLNGESPKVLLNNTRMPNLVTGDWLEISRETIDLQLAALGDPSIEWEVFAYDLYL